MPFGCWPMMLSHWAHGVQMDVPGTGAVSASALCCMFLQLWQQMLAGIQHNSCSAQCISYDAASVDANLHNWQTDLVTWSLCG